MGYQFPIFSDKALDSLDKIEDCRTQPVSTEVARKSDRVQLHPGIQQRQCQREWRFSLPPAFVSDRTRPQWSQKPYSVRRRTPLPHPLARPNSWRTLRRACRLGWAGVLRPELWLGWAHALPSRFSRFSQTRAPNDGGRPRCSIWRIRCPCSFSRRIARYPLGISCKRMYQRFRRRFRVYSPYGASAYFRRWHGPRPTRRLLRASNPTA